MELMPEEIHQQQKSWLRMKKRIFHSIMIFEDINWKQLVLGILIMLAMLIVYHAVFVDKDEGRLQHVMAKIAAIEKELDHARDEIASLKYQMNETKEKLETDKVDKIEFTNLSDDVTSLREDTSQADEDIREDLNDLANNTLQHYHQLQDDIDKLKHSKANQNNFEELVVHVNDLADSTVQTTDFHQAIDAINKTTRGIQEDIVELTMNVTTLTHHIHQINITLASKADQVVLHQLTEKLSTLEASMVPRDMVSKLEQQITAMNSTLVTVVIDEQAESILLSNLSAIGVGKREFEKLSSVVDSLKTRMVDKTSFNELSSTVNAHTKSLNQQDNQLEDHKSSVQQRFSRITDRLDQVEGDRRWNTGDITNLKNNFEDLKSDITKECRDTCKPSFKDVWNNSFG